MRSLLCALSTRCTRTDTGTASPSRTAALLLLVTTLMIADMDDRLVRTPVPLWRNPDCAPITRLMGFDATPTNVVAEPPTKPESGNPSPDGA